MKTNDSAKINWMTFKNRFVIHISDDQTTKVEDPKDSSDEVVKAVGGGGKSLQHFLEQRLLLKDAKSLRAEDQQLPSPTLDKHKIANLAELLVGRLNNNNNNGNENNNEEIDETDGNVNNAKRPRSKEDDEVEDEEEDETRKKVKTSEDDFEAKDEGDKPSSATAMASVQAAVAALQAGQMSLNQVRLHFPFFCPIFYQFIFLSCRFN